MRKEFNRWNKQSGVQQMLDGLTVSERPHAVRFLASWDMMHGDPESQEGFDARGKALKSWIEEYREGTP